MSGSYPDVEIVAYEDGTVTTIVATKNGPNAGTATLYKNGAATTLSASLPAGNNANATGTSSVAVVQYDRLSVFMDPDNGNWGYTAATIDFTPT